MENGEIRRRRTQCNSAISRSQEGPVENAPDIFSDNTNCLIDNPFSHMTPSDAAQNGRNFALQNGLETKVELFEMVARVLQDPAAYKLLSRLSEDEKKALKRVLESETRSNDRIWSHLRQNIFRYGGWRAFRDSLFPVNGFWRQPKQLRSTTLMLCVAAVVQGWCQASSNGANLNWALELLGPPTVSGGHGECDPTGRHAWIFAFVNAAPYLSASLVGCWLSDPLSEGLLGRRAPIAISAISVVASAIGSAFIQRSHWGLLLLCRFILGIGMGTKAAVVPVFAAEIAPAHLRGALVMNWQLFDAFGILAGFTANLIASTAGANAWRWEFASAALPALVLLGQIYAAPESPRFLMMQGMRARDKEDTQERDRKFRAAYDTFLALRGEPILAAKELLYAHEQMLKERKFLSLKPLLEDQEHQQGRQADKFTKRVRFFHKLRIIFVKKRTRRALLAAVVVMLSQQLCGINVLMFYSSTVYGDLGLGCGQANASEHLRPLLLSWGIGLANFLFAFPAYWLIDRRGRRFLLLTTLPLMTIAILAAGLSYLIPAHNPAYVPVIGLFTYIFVALYSVGLGPVPFTYSAECFPLEVRMVGMAFAVFTNLLGAGILALFVPVLTFKLGHKLGHLRLLSIFAGLNVVAFVLVFLFVPETAGVVVENDPAEVDGRRTAMSLEELNYVFGIKTEKHMEYQYKEVLRDYFWRRYIIRDCKCRRPECSDPNCSDPKHREPRKIYRWQRERAQSRAEALSASTTRDDLSQAPQAFEMQTAQPQRSIASAQSRSEATSDRNHEVTQSQAQISRQDYVLNAERAPHVADNRTADSHDITADSSDGTRVTWSEETSRDMNMNDGELSLPSGPRFWQMMQYLSDRVTSLERGGNDIALRPLNGAESRQH